MHTEQKINSGNFHILKPRKALNKAFLKLKPNRSKIELFKSSLKELLDRTNDTESEEFHKNLVTDFLKKTYYNPNHFINTKGRNDLVIHNGNKPKSSVGVIIEAKKPTNRTEMLSKEKINVKAFQELVLYYLRERITQKNLEVKYLIATNINEWFIFDANIFEKAFAENKQLVNQFTDFEAGRLAGKTTDFFYKEIAEPFIAQLQQEVECTHFDIRNYEKPLRNNNPKDDNKLITLFKLFSPEHLLKLPFFNDSNSLDKKFYGELLHIIGLTETKQGGKKIIERQKEGQRNTGSFLENAIIQLDSTDKIGRLQNPSHFGKNQQERLFNVGLELSITWLNRILFLKLLEAQLITYHKGDRSYEFLSLERIQNYDDLNSLFFQVLARQYNERNEDVKVLFEKVPYLNSSLFEPTDIEHSTLFISNLRDDKTLPIYSATVLKDKKGKKRSGEINALEYLFEFLNSYDFSSEGGEMIQEDNKTLINASVLGLIFEKINGYKDGSFFTPGFITMYMCRETIRKAVVQKFNETKNWDCKDLEQLYDRIEDRQEANELINSIKICDPAVGSGHFLVSALNEIIAIKNDLNILQDRSGRRLKEYQVEVVNDELVVTDEEGELFEYNPTAKESQRIQEALFHEKQQIIENCLFGVDINPNSVKICRLRLWIELLKNAYYKNDTELETLPNIDINIKCGNSLISRFDLDADLSKALKESKWNIDSYRTSVDTYRNAENKEQKREMEKIIHDIKNDFRSEISSNDPKIKKLQKVKSKLFLMTEQPKMFELSKREKSKWNKKVEQLSKESKKLETAIQEIKDNKIYENAFEWRFEFPEVLNDDGDYIGFDVVIGNPPYFSLSKIKDQSEYFSKADFKTYSKGADIYCLFYERGGQIMKDYGVLTFITSNSWLRGIYGDLLKNYFVKNLQPVSLMNIEDIQVFEEATVESNIITLQKGYKAGSFPVVNLSKEYSMGSSLSEFFDQNSFEFKIPKSSDWFIGNEEESKLKLKIEKGSKLLKEFSITINFGLKTGYNAAFILNEATKKNLILADPKNEELIKPILRGRDVQKYIFDFDGFYLLNTHNGVKAKDISRINVERDYPEIERFLESYLPKVQERYDQGDHWTNLRNCVYIEDFEKPKIIWGEISDRPKFAYDDSGFYAEATTFLMTGEKLKFLLAILNSKVSEWYFNLVGTTTGMGTNRWKKYKIQMLPIKVATLQEEEILETLVNQIIELKKENATADTSSLEAEIDRLVYELYGLTEEEIGIVEEA
ncbi:Type II restriction/modification system, DNA methylase subunit YeeA [Salegentibacter echinorum]|uniref:site-specific DNA-methyltransferase (adenine-specific) n=1 Tax=Salegentibacter echinorum TaxID=1073325 RepID=A0A1M5BFB4_SALEC|nr:TaqI-like C-terminal specificity domain-containing protein [Salegentibacter echinorum]SHF41243.1 Type II restriction/modification system, DNA methylase subunit YeeA [Salegentibacter echinorum]